MDLIQRLRRGVGIVSGRTIAALSGFTVRPDDVFLVSYPKSGNTWTRFLVGNAATGADGSVDFTSIDAKVPDIHKISAAALDALPGRRFIKSHSAFDPRYPKVIYVVRNPLDVLVSYFHFQRKNGVLPADATIADYAGDFLEQSGNYGTWAQNVESWTAAMAGNPNFLLLRYEDMLADTARELRKVLAFAGLPADEEILARTVQLSSSEAMRRLEQEQAGAWQATRNSDRSIPFVRKASSGGWREEMDEGLATKIAERWAIPMRRLGYLDERGLPA